MAPATILVALFLAAAGPAPAPDLRARVSALLGAIHGPVPAESLRALGPGVEEVLADLALTDPFPSRRIRALQALEGLGGARAEAVHRAIASDRAAPSAVRMHAVGGLGRLVPKADAPAALAPLLESDPDPRVRATAAEALARRAPDVGCARVRDRVLREDEPERFGRALAACDRTSPTTPPAR